MNSRPVYAYKKHFSLSVILVTLSILVGWILDIAILRNIIPGLIALISVILLWNYTLSLNKIHDHWIDTEKNLKLSESKFSSAFNYSGIGMALVSPGGEWVDINDALCNMLGYTKAEMAGLTFQEITQEDNSNANVSKEKELLQGTVNTYETEKQFIHKNGTLVSVNVTTSLIREMDNNPKFFVIQVVDITVPKKLMEEVNLKNSILTTTTEDLEIKMKQLEEFNKIVAHNLRGPAGSIFMMIGMAAEAETVEERNEMLEMLKASSQNLNDTLNDLMSVLEVRLNKSIAFDSCDLEQLTQQVSTMLKGEIITKKAKIQTDFEMKQMHYPKVYLESIFYNMMSNALKYSKETAIPEIHITSKLVNDRVMLRFKDNGLGIDLNKHGHNLFKLNKVFHAGYDSKGVGLFMTKNHVETFGGSIEVKSEPLSGSEFIVVL